MRRRALIAAVLICVASAVSQAQKAVDLYQQALTQERALGNLEQAIQLFDLAAKESATDRLLAAKAMLGEARSYEKLGLPRASSAYEELIRTFPDQREQVGIAGLHLAAINRAAENFNFESGVLGQTPLRWSAGQSQSAGPGFKFDLVATGCLEGFRCAVITGVPDPPQNWFGNVSHRVNPQPYLGKVVRFRAAIKVEGAGTVGRLWMRFDHAGGGSSSGDNSANRPIIAGPWNYYSMTGAVAADTNAIFIGVIINGSGRVWVDDVTFETDTAPIRAATSTIAYASNLGPTLPMNGATAVSQAIGPPSSVAADGLGGIYVAALAFSQVYHVAFEGTLRTIAGTGTGGFTGDSSNAASARLLNPRQIALDSMGNLYIADNGNNRIRKVSLAGAISTVAGNGKSGFSGDGGPAISAALASPVGVAIDRSGNLFISDSRNNRIRKVTPDGSITTIAGTGNPGYSGDGGPAIFAEINPTGLAVDSAGDLFIADSFNHRVRKVTPEGVISTVAGNGTQGYRGDGGLATSAELADPVSVAADGAGSLFIADNNNNRIRKVTPDGLISTVAGNGTTLFNGDGIPATSAGLGVMGLAVDSAGNLFIADASNNRIRKVTPAGVISTFAGNGNRP